MKILDHMFRCVVAVLLAVGSGAAIAEERLYGSFVYSSEIPNALFFMDEIKNGDDFELRKALRNHDVDTIVLASPGGSVWASLSMAGIIFDKKLRAFVPKDAVCASACSYMFFGGNERLSEGKLGVHQFASSDQTEKTTAVLEQAQSQYTVSEIIGFLNEFETPRFVFERMFEKRDMYWFNENETQILNSEHFTLNTETASAMSAYIAKKIAEAEAVEAAKPKYSQKELVALIQKRLNEVGCSAGLADGIWGSRTNAAAVRFAKKAGLSTKNDDLISEAFFNALADAQEGFCPKLVVKANQVQSFARAYQARNSCQNTKHRFRWLVSYKPGSKRFSYQISWEGNSSKSGTMFAEFQGNRIKFYGSSGRLSINRNGFVSKMTIGKCLYLTAI